jgi:hypothetical protein
MKRLMEETREATGDRTGSNFSTRLIVQRYWRRLANGGGLRDHGRRPKRVSNFKVHHTDRPMDKKLRQSER